MDTNSLENTLYQSDSEATYRALRDSILQIYQFGTKIAKESNSDNELQVSWELGDTSLMGWISDTHCYLSRKGQKLQFLARPSKLEIISFSLDEGDKLLICNDSLRQNLSDNEIDEILQESQGSESSCQNLLKVVNVSQNASENPPNIVVMEVINNQKVITPTPILENKKTNSKSSKIGSKWLILSILIFLFLSGISLLVWRNKDVNFKSILGKNDNITLEDTLNFINKDSIEVAVAKDTITKEFANQSQDFSETKDEEKLIKTPTKELKPESNNATQSDDSFFNDKPTKNKPKGTFKESRDIITPSPSKNSRYFDVAKEEENYNALMQQKARWIVIRDDLQNILNSGNTAALDKLKNSEKVLKRIEEKLQDSGRKLGRN